MTICGHRRFASPAVTKSARRLPIHSIRNISSPNVFVAPLNNTHTHTLLKLQNCIELCGYYRCLTVNLPTMRRGSNPRKNPWRPSRVSSERSSSLSPFISKNEGTEGMKQLLKIFCGTQQLQNTIVCKVNIDEPVF